MCTLALNTNCYDLGYQLPELTFPGQSASSTLLTSAPAGTPSATDIPALSSIINLSSPISTSPKATGSSTTSIPGFVSAAMDVGSGNPGVWALAAAAVGMVVL